MTDTLQDLARRFGTPCYVYFVDQVRERLQALRSAFRGRFAISYAVKANPNLGLLARLRDEVERLDVSSVGEVERALQAGYPAGRLSFSGPAKRPFELERAVEVGVGEMICESPGEIAALDALARRAGRRMGFLVRLNPARMPSSFGVQMAGKPSQFGVDEEEAPALLESLKDYSGLDFRGFHIYSGTNCLDPGALAENFEIFVELFERLSLVADCRPQTLIFGSGFGIPYHPDEGELDLAALAARLNPLLEPLDASPRLAQARCVLELGRWLVGPAGFFLTSVVGTKRSRGSEIRLLDGGFNNHLAAWGMLGAVIRRNWRIRKVSPGDDGQRVPYILAGPLCTTVDRMAQKVELPELSVGDVLAIESSGAYGLSASPTGFISHPAPREILVDGGEALDVTEV